MPIQSGDIGYCMALRRTTALVRTWEKETVTYVDCGYETCGYSDSCKLYQHNPVGYHSSTPTFDNERI